MTEPFPGLDAPAVSAWMAERLVGVVLPVQFGLITGGHSNITYTVTDGAGHGFVVRRPPLGTAGGRAHDVGREFEVMAALRGSAVPVPQALARCDDVVVTGAPFYVMSRVDGVVVDNPAAADRHLPSPAARRRAGEQVVDVLADLHRVNIDAAGLGGAAKREDYLQRQIARFRGVWRQNATRELPAMDRLADRLQAAAPPQRYTGIVHGDYRLGNVMLGPDGTLLAVLDWELWTLGDVLADLGFLLNNWYEPADDIPLVWMEVPPTVAGGFGTRAEVLERYSAGTGFDLSGVGYYQAFQFWKVAVLAEGVKKRYESAQMPSVDVDFAHLAQRVVDLAVLADAHLAEYESR